LTDDFVLISSDTSSASKRPRRAGEIFAGSVRTSFDRQFTDFRPEENALALWLCIQPSRTLDEFTRCPGNRPHPVFTTGERPPKFLADFAPDAALSMKLNLLTSNKF
jgi:hypothetical protein